MAHCAAVSLIAEMEQRVQQPSPQLAWEQQQDEMEQQQRQHCALLRPLSSSLAPQLSPSS
jgi:hypothetical protein